MLLSKRFTEIRTIYRCSIIGRMEVEETMRPVMCVILVRFGSMRRTHRLSRTNVYANNYPSTDDDSLDRVLTE